MTGAGGIRGDQPETTRRSGSDPSSSRPERSPTTPDRAGAPGSAGAGVSPPAGSAPEDRPASAETGAPEDRFRWLLGGTGRVDLEEAYAMGPRTWRANMVASLDGAAALDGRTGGLSSPADQHLLHLLRSLADAVVVGVGTVEAEHYGPLVLPPGLKRRRRARGQDDAPRLVVVSGSASLRPDAPYLRPNAGGQPAIVATTERADPGRRRALAEVAEVVVCGAREIEGSALREALHRRGLEEVVCEGGPTLLGRLVDGGVIDELCLTLAPVVVGPSAHTLVAALDRPVGVRLRHVLEADGSLFLRAAITSREGASPSEE